jgi:hypothetical protein
MCIIRFVRSRFICFCFVCRSANESVALPRHQQRQQQQHQQYTNSSSSSSSFSRPKDYTSTMSISTSSSSTTATHRTAALAGSMSNVCNFRQVSEYNCVFVVVATNSVRNVLFAVQSLLRSTQDRFALPTLPNLTRHGLLSLFIVNVEFDCFVSCSLRASSIEYRHKRYCTASTTTEHFVIVKYSLSVCFRVVECFKHFFFCY